MIARYAPQPPIRPSQAIRPESSGSVHEPALVALGMLCVPLIAFCFIVGMFVIMAG